MAVHRQKLSCGKHCSPHLQAAWDKHGAENFTFRVLLCCHAKDLVFFEQHLVDGYRAMDPAFGYNKRVVVQSNAGMVLSDEHKRKISASLGRGKDNANFGKPLCAKAIQAAADLKRGKPMPVEQRAKISAASRGVKKPPGFGAILSAARTGIRFSDEVRKNMSAARTGMVQTRSAKESKGKIDYAKAAELRQLHLSGIGPHSRLAEMFGISRGRVSAILRGESWV